MKTVKKKKKDSNQASMFTVAEAYGMPKVVIPSREEIVKSQEGVFKFKPPPEFRQKVAFSATTCPNCTGKVYLAPDGTRRCESCGWWQGNAE